MKRMQPCHKEVESEEQHVTVSQLIEICGAGENTMIELGAPLEIFIHQEYGRQEDRCSDKDQRKLLFVLLNGCDRHGDRRTADQQDNCIDGTNGDIKLLAGQVKSFRVHVPVYGVSDEQSAKQEQLRKNKKPHTEL